MNKSSVKTWMRRNKFSPTGYGSNWRNCIFRGSFKKTSRLYRVRRQSNEWVVDIGETTATFDRWANSTITTLPMKFFMRHGWPFDAGMCGNGKMPDVSKTLWAKLTPTTKLRGESIASVPLERRVRRLTSADF